MVQRIREENLILASQQFILEVAIANEAKEPTIER